jgi:ATP-dependent RNA helicase DeaD
MQAAALKDIARQTNVQIDVLAIPTGRDVKNKTMDGFISEIEETIKNEDTAQFKGVYDALAASGYTPDEIALAALTLQFGKNAAKLKQIKEVAGEKEPDKKPKSRPHAQAGKEKESRLTRKNFTIRIKNSRKQKRGREKLSRK